MNRFGIRLAAGLAVITLGTLAVLQARSGSETPLEEPWPETVAAAATEPPAPLGIEEDTWSTLPDDSETVVRGNNRAPAADSQPSDVAAAGPSSDFATGSVQLASHDEPAAEADDAPPASAFTFPEPLSVAEPAEPEVAAGPSFAVDPEAAAEPADADVPANAAAGAKTTAVDTPAFAMPATAPALPAENTLRSDVNFGEGESAPVGSSLQMPSTRQSASAPANPPQGAASPQTLDVPQEFDNPELSATAEDAPTSEPSIPAAPSPLSAAELAPATAAPWGGASLQPLPSDPAASAAAVTDQPEPQSGEPQPAEVDDPASLHNQPYDSQPSDSQPYGGAPAGGRASGAANPVAASQPSPASAALQTVEPSEVLSLPGERRLEGAQTPSVVIHKRAPEEVRVGKPAEFVIQVRNVGTVAALDVRIFDSVPEGMELVDTVPSATESDAMLVWQLGDLEPGGERTVTMKLIPRSEGELGSVARVTFEAAASVRTVATRPQLKLVQRAPEQVLIGQQVEIEVELSNTGSGAATGVMLQADLPDGLEHPMGRQLDNLVGTMPPGDVRRQILRLRATKPGRVVSTVRLTGEDGVSSESKVEIETVSPALEVALDGPSMRYLERQTTYNVQIGNSGTANAADVDVVAYLDRGLKFVSTEFEGQYDPNHHAVFWSLAELPVGQKGEVPLTLLPVEAGTQSVRLEATAELGIKASSEKELAIETLAELNFSIADDQDPIETGAETTYEVRVQNSGSRDDSNVQLKVQLPPGMELISADPQAGTDGNGLVVFQPVAALPAKGEQKFRIRVRGASADTHVIRAMLSSDQSPKAITKEESTTVYSDQ